MDEVVIIMSSGTSEVLLNGVPGKKFPCRRGVRQGDPLSPLLYVAASELLQAMVNMLHLEGTLQPPLRIPNSDFPIIQYADDTLLVMEACPIQLAALKLILEHFAQATGLRVNYAKSALMSINISDDQLQSLALSFGCAVGSLPFTYLGLPMGTTKPTIHDLSPLVGLVERRLNASARFLNYGGRLEFVRSVLSTLPTFFMSSLKLQKTIIEICNRAQRHCLWAKEEESRSGNALAAWSMVCRPKQHGGLGVLNLELQNKALLLKQLHKFYSRDPTPWVTLVWSLYGNGVPHAMPKRGSFWWKDIFGLVEDYRSVTRCQVHNGASVLFWKDFWSEGEPMCNRFPRLFSFSCNEDISVAAMVQQGTLNDRFFLPLSVEAFQEWQDINRIISDLHLSEQQIDTRVFVWGTNYTPSKYYKFLFALLPKDIALNAIWKSRAMPKLKVFSWLLFKDRLNTRDLMQRKHWHIDTGYNCVMCSQNLLETSQHLFFECEFAQRCWDLLDIHWDFAADFGHNFSSARANFSGPCFFEIFACATWNIWKVRNDLIFNNVVAVFARWKVCFQSDLLLHRYRVKEASVQPLVEWITNIFL
jgi:hypothetical protein